jgi:Domain of unknown function (DUF5658)
MRIWMLAFAKVNALDLFMTWLLVGSGTAYEANPLAATAWYGWWGVVALKVVSLALVLLLGLLIYQRRPKTARRLLRFACVVTGAVVAYSVCVLVSLRHDFAGVQREARREAGLQREWRQSRRYLTKIYDLADAVAAQQLRLPQAAKELALFLEEIDYRRPVQFMRHIHDGWSPEGQLACLLMNTAGFLLRDQPGLARHVLPHLEQDLARYYGRPTAYELQWFPGGYSAARTQPCDREIAPGNVSGKTAVPG